MELKELLGPAFNGRYMSVERPAESDEALIITEHTEETGECVLNSVTQKMKSQVNQSRKF